MEQGKRMAGSYEIKHAIHIGDKEIVYGEDINPKSDAPYIAANYTCNELLEEYDKIVGSKDYIEIMEEFISRVKGQIDMVKKAQQQVTVSQKPLTSEHCYPNDPDKSIENMVVAIKASSLRPEFRSGDYQMVLVTGGFGSHGKARGRAVFTKNIYHGFEERWNREDIQGVVKEKFVPEWAREKLQQLDTQDDGHAQEPELNI